MRAILRVVFRVRPALGAGVAWSWLTSQRRGWIERQWVWWVGQFFNLFLNVVRHVLSVWVFQAFACCVFLVVRFVRVCSHVCPCISSILEISWLRRSVLVVKPWHIALAKIAMGAIGKALAMTIDVMKAEGHRHPLRRIQRMLRQPGAITAGPI